MHRVIILNSGRIIVLSTRAASNFMVLDSSEDTMKIVALLHAAIEKREYQFLHRALCTSGVVENLSRTLENQGQEVSLHRVFDALAQKGQHKLLRDIHQVVNADAHGYGDAHQMHYPLIRVINCLTANLKTFGYNMHLKEGFIRKSAAPVPLVMKVPIISCPDYAY